LEHLEDRAEKHANEIEARAEQSLANFSRSMRLEVRWLIVASVGLNQIFNNIQVPDLAKAGVAGAALVGFKVLTAFFSAP
jgi:hypothetical protein